jgi:hypothetical protein
MVRTTRAKAGPNLTRNSARDRCQVQLLKYMFGISKPDLPAHFEHLCAMCRHGRALSRYLAGAVTEMEVPTMQGA